MRTQILAVAAVVVLYASGVLAAQQPAADTYQWHGELVAFDATANTVTVKARLVDQEAVNDVKKFKAGDRIVLQWSGYDVYADAIRRVMPYTAGKATDRFMLAAELVSPETPNQYVTFRVRIPSGGATALKSVRAGEWITVTASHKPASETQAVVSVRPYTSTSSAATH